MSRSGRAPDAAARLLNGLGLAARAGQLRIGTDAVARSISGGRAFMVVLAGDAPPPVRKRLARMMGERSMPHKLLLDGDRIGRALGRERVVAVAVTDRSLGKRVLELAEALEG